MPRPIWTFRFAQTTFPSPRAPVNLICGMSQTITAKGSEISKSSLQRLLINPESLYPYVVTLARCLVLRLRVCQVAIETHRERYVSFTQCCSWCQSKNLCPTHESSELNCMIIYMHTLLHRASSLNGGITFQYRKHIIPYLKNIPQNIDVLAVSFPFFRHE